MFTEDRVFGGKTAEFIDDKIPLGKKKTVGINEEDPDNDLDPDNILNHQKFPDVSQSIKHLFIHINFPISYLPNRLISKTDHIRQKLNP